MAVTAWCPYAHRPWFRQESPSGPPRQLRRRHLPGRHRGFQIRYVQRWPLLLRLLRSHLLKIRQLPSRFLPGAVSAWRRSRKVPSGGHSSKAVLRRFPSFPDERRPLPAGPWGCACPCSEQGGAGPGIGGTGLDSEMCGPAGNTMSVPLEEAPCAVPLEEAPCP